MARGRTRPRNREAVRKDPLSRHLHALGFETVGSYREWCRTCGLDDSTRKPRWRLDEEIAVRRAEWTARAASRARHPERRPAHVLLRACQQENRPVVRAEQAGSMADRFRKALETSGIFGRRQTRELAALEDLIRHLFLNNGLSAASKLLKMEPVILDLGPRPGNSYLEALIPIAEFRSSWVRPIEQFKSRSKSGSRIFSALLRHLFARYNVPAVMDEVWFTGPGPANTSRRGWFVHVGTGRSIRECRLPVTLTRRAAHAFQSAPTNLRLDAALRYAQAIGAGCDNRGAYGLATSRLSEDFGNEPFWQTVIDWFGRYPMIDFDQIGPLLDYIHHAKFVPTAIFDNGRLTERPTQPQLSMSGQTPDRLLRRMHEWHRELGRSNRAQTPAWPASGIRPHSETGGSSAWVLRELLSAKALEAESRVMRHCVASYAHSCARRVSSIWTLERHPVAGLSGGMAGDVQKCVTIEVRLQTRQIVQVRGRNNRRMNDAEKALLQRWAAAAELTLSDHA